MGWFQLDPQSIARRVEAAGGPIRIPTLGDSIVRGIAGFTIVSVAGFAPWPIFQRWFHHLGEVDLYLACGAVFIALSGPCLHRLIIGPGSLPRFYKLFSIAFVAYAVLWVFFWMWLRGDAGSPVGLFAGTGAMGLILAWAFDAPRAILPAIAVLFALNTLGYSAGALIAGKLIHTHPIAAMLLWGVCYGIGFGAGLGVAFHLCQARTRAALGASVMNAASGATEAA